MSSWQMTHNLCDGWMGWMDGWAQCSECFGHYILSLKSKFSEPLDIFRPSFYHLRFFTKLGAINHHQEPIWCILQRRKLPAPSWITSVWVRTTVRTIFISLAYLEKSFAALTDLLDIWYNDYNHIDIMQKTPCGNQFPRPNIFSAAT